MNDLKRASVHWPLQRGLSIFLTHESTRDGVYRDRWLAGNAKPTGIPSVRVFFDELLNRVEQSVVLLKGVPQGGRIFYDDFVAHVERNFLIVHV